MRADSAPIYPTYAFNESPTWFTWVKLTAADVHGLREVDGFQGQNIYFHLNHPIRYVCLTGVIISIEDKFNKYILVEIDDGSNALITIKILRLAALLKGESVQEDKTVTCVDYPSNTSVPNLDVIAEIGRYDVLVDGHVVDIGAVVKVKCTIDTFRQSRQLELKRIWVLRSTAEEVKEWSDAAKFKKDVLMHPWILSKEQLKSLEMEDRHKRARALEQEQRQAQLKKLEEKRRVKRAEKLREHEKKKESRRRKEETVMNAGAIA